MQSGQRLLDFALWVVLRLGNLPMHLIDNSHRHREATKQVDPPDARKRQHRACVRDDYSNIDGSTRHDFVTIMHVRYVDYHRPVHNATAFHWLWLTPDVLNYGTRRCGGCRTT